MRSVWRNVRLLGLVAVLVFVAAACRSSKNESSNQTSGGGAAQQTTGGAAATSGTGTAGAKLTASDVGVTPTEIVLGANYPLTGPAASYSAIPKAIQAYFAYINDQGGVNGRKITFKTMDDAYDPSKTVAVIRQLVDQQKVFAVFNSLGTPTHSAVYDYLNEQKVPDMYVASGAGKWNDPKNHPWTFGYQPSYPSEAEIEAKYYQQNFAGKKVGLLYQNDDFGKDYLNTFKAKASGAPIVSEQSYESTATDVSSQVTSMRNAGAEVVFIWAIPKFAAQAIKFIHDSGWKPAIIMTSVSADPTVIKDAGTDAAEGVITAGYAPQYDDDSNQDIQFIKKTMAKYAPGAEINNFTVYGFSVASVMVETLKRAGNDLTRQGLVKAAESIKDFQPLATLGKATMTPNDHTPLHCMKLEKVQNGEYVYFGDLICSEVKQ